MILGSPEYHYNSLNRFQKWLLHKRYPRYVGKDGKLEKFLFWCEDCNAPHINYKYGHPGYNERLVCTGTSTLPSFLQPLYPLSR